MNPALEQYIRENLAKGYTADDLAQAIRAQGGWTEEDIAAAFANIKAETLPTPNSAPSTPPQASTMNVNTPKSAVSETSPAPSVSSAPAVTAADASGNDAWVDRSAPKEHDPNAGGWHGSVEEFAEINARKRRVLGIAGLSVAVVALAAVGGYLSIVSLSVTPEQALLKSVVAMREMNSLRYHATGTLAMALLPQGEMIEQTAMVLGTGEKANAKFEFALDGAIELVEASTTVKHQRMDISLSGDGSAGPFSVALGGKIGMVQVPPDMYLTFIKMPKFVGFLDLTFLEGRSIHFTEEELVGTPGAGEALGALTATSSPALFGPKFDPELLSEETRTKLGESYRTHAPLVISESDEKITLGESSAREFTVRMDRLAFDRFMAEAATYAPEFTEGAEKPETKEALNILASTTVTFQIEEKSYFMRSMVLNMPFATSSPEFQVDATLTLAMTLDGINEPVAIVIPDGALRQEEFQKEIEKTLEKDPRILEANPFLMGALSSLGEARTKARDAKRVSDLAQLQLALELYYDEHQQYPTTLEPLAPMYLPEIPVSDGDPAYSYIPLKSKGVAVTCDGRGVSCQSYVLGASLEDPRNVVLRSDTDLFRKGFKGFNGSDLAGCRGERDRACYDVSP